MKDKKDFYKFNQPKQFVKEDKITKLEKNEIVVKVKEEINKLSKVVESIDEIQKVEITNPVEIPEVVFPETQKVEITNGEDLPKVVFPETQKVTVDNFPEPQKIEIPDSVKINNVEDLATKIASKIIIPSKVKAEVTNQPEVQKMPLGKGNNPKTADPEQYLNVRLTDGKKFYAALSEFYVAAGKPGAGGGSSSGGGIGSSVSVTNFPSDQGVHITPGYTTAVSGTFISTTASGQPGLNFPTVQTVNIQNMPAISISPTASGSPNNSFIDNFPTIQSVREQSPITTITTLSGSMTDIKNFPTVQTVNIQNMPSVTTVSGFHVTIDNFPTFQSVSPIVLANNSTSPVTISGVVDMVANTPTMVSGVGTAVQQIKATATIIDSYYVYNPNSSVSYLQFFDVAAATNVTLGTTIPKWSIGIPATSAANLSDVALQFLNGLKIAATTTAGGSTSPAIGIDVNIGYK